MSARLVSYRDRSQARSNFRWVPTGRHDWKENLPNDALHNNKR
jgi:hypothetical protein